MIQGNDGGACVSLNGGDSWSTIYNQLTAQFYRIAVDNRFPYRVLATQQDNSSICVPSATEFGAIPWSYCYAVGTGESGDVAFHPDEPDIAFVGAVGSSPGGNGVLQRYDHRTRQIQLVSVWPEESLGSAQADMKYRFSWTFPVSFSPHDSNVLYAAGNIIFRSLDEGQSWEPISPDLTRNDPETLQASGGPITKDNTGAEGYGSVYAFAESLLEAGLLWAGSDDGLVHVSRNGGDSWENNTPDQLPEFSLIGCIEPSPHDAGTAWMAATRFKLDEYEPLLFRTTDFGATWDDVAVDFPTGEVTRVIREDPVCRGLLYVGTDTGICFSPDAGVSWEPLATNLPVVPVYDLAVAENDLVVGTHGRSFWVLDDVTPLRDRAAGAIGPPAYLFPPVPSYRRCWNWSVSLFRGPGKNYMLGLGAQAGYYYETAPDGEQVRRPLDAGQNPPNGVIIYYLLSDDVSEPIKLDILDAADNLIRSYTVRDENRDEEDEGDEPPADRWITVDAGLNRFVWDMRYPSGPRVIPKKAEKKPASGTRYEKLGENEAPLAVPGLYRVRLTVGSESWIQPFEIRKDPRTTTTPEGFEQQFDLWSRIHNRVGEVNRAINEVRHLRGQVKEWRSRANRNSQEQLSDATAELAEQLWQVEDTLTRPGKEELADMIRLPGRLRERLTTLLSVVGIADTAPTSQAHALFEEVETQIDAQMVRLARLLESELPALNRMIQEAGLPPIAPRE